MKLKRRRRKKKILRNSVFLATSLTTKYSALVCVRVRACVTEWLWTVCVHLYCGPFPVLMQSWWWSERECVCEVGGARATGTAGPGQRTRTPRALRPEQTPPYPPTRMAGVARRKVWHHLAKWNEWEWLSNRAIIFLKRKSWLGKRVGCFVVVLFCFF